MYMSILRFFYDKHTNNLFTVKSYNISIQICYILFCSGLSGSLHECTTYIIYISAQSSNIITIKIILIYSIIFLIFLVLKLFGANLEKKSKETCYKTPKNVWCCSSTTHCHTTKADCEKKCIL